MFQKKMADAFDSARTFFTTACGRMHGSGQPEGISALENRLMQFCSRRQPLRIYADTCSLLCADGEALLTAAERVLPQYQAQLLIFSPFWQSWKAWGRKRRRSGRTASGFWQGFSRWSVPAWCGCASGAAQASPIPTSSAILCRTC